MMKTSVNKSRFLLSHNLWVSVGVRYCVAADALNRNHVREHEPNDGVIELPSRNAERLNWTRLGKARFGL
jgi:hypothetical protein